MTGISSLKFGEQPKLVFSRSLERFFSWYIYCVSRYFIDLYTEYTCETKLKLIRL